MVERGDTTQQKTGSFRISTAINKPRHVFVYIINDANDESQTANKFLYNTFSVVDNKALNSCFLEVGNGKEYPEVHYRPSDEPTRVFRDVLKYVHANSDYAGDTLINRSNFGGGSNPQVTGRRSQVTGRGSWVAGRRSQVAGRRSQVAGRRSQVAGRRSQVAGRRSQVAASFHVRRAKVGPYITH